MSLTGDAIPTDPESQFAAWKGDIEKRLRALESSPALPFSSSRGGRIRWKDPDDNIMTLFGLFNNGITDFQGHVMYDVNDKAVVMIRADKAGLVHPEFQAVFVPLNSFTAVTSGTFVPTHRLNPTHVYHEVLRVALRVQSGAGSVGEIRIKENISGITTNVLTTTAGANQTAVFEWIHPVAVSTGTGSNGDFELEARRVSGANSIDVYMSTEAQWSSSALLPGASTGGALGIF
jgi:hypothetical protein